MPTKLDPREPDPLHRELEAEADEEAKVLPLRRGSVSLVADFAARTVELSR